jgi:DNA repair exonuclease SbcCD ATPase subunit
LSDFILKHLDDNPRTLINPLIDKLQEGLLTEPKTKAEQESQDKAIKEIDIKATVGDIDWNALKNIQNQLEVIRRHMSAEDDLAALKKHLTTEQYNEYHSIMIDKKSKHPTGIFQTIAYIYSTRVLPIESFRQLCLDDNGNCYKGFENTYNAILKTVKAIPQTNE